MFLGVRLNVPLWQVSFSMPVPHRRLISNRWWQLGSGAHCTTRNSCNIRHRTGQLQKCVAPLYPTACSRPTWSACQNTGGRVPPPVSDCTSLGWGDLFPAVAAGGPGTTPGEGGLKAPLKAVSPSRPYWTYCQRTPPIQSSPTGSPFPHSLFISWFKTMVSKLLFFGGHNLLFF